MDFYGHIQDGKLSLSESVKEARTAYLASLPNGGAIKETIRPIARPTTNSQRKAFFAMIVSVTGEELANAGWDVHGVPLTKDQVKAVVYHFCAPKDENGKNITLSNHPESSLENTMATFDNACRWLASKFGRVVPDPDPAWRQKR